MVSKDINYIRRSHQILFYFVENPVSLDAFPLSPIVSRERAKIHPAGEPGGVNQGSKKEGIERRNLFYST
jgi:hypothetical protein